MSTKRTVFNSILIIVGVAFGLAILAGVFFVTRQTLVPVTAVANLAAVPAAPQQSLYVGLGNTLELAGQQARVIAPPSLARPAGQSVYLGSGYTLETNGSLMELKSSFRPAQPAASRLYVGEGHTLEVAGNRGQMISTGTQMQAASQPKLYLGTGYWLENGRVVDGSK